MTAITSNYFTSPAAQLLHKVTPLSEYITPPPLLYYDPVTKLKTCTCCHHPLTLHEFSYWPSTGRYAAKCKACCKIVNREYHRKYKL